MKTVKQLLDSKGNEVWTIPPDESVLDGIQKMADKNVGGFSLNSFFSAYIALRTPSFENKGFLKFQRPG